MTWTAQQVIAALAEVHPDTEVFISRVPQLGRPRTTRAIVKVSSFPPRQDQTANGHPKVGQVIIFGE